MSDSDSEASSLSPVSKLSDQLQKAGVDIADIVEIAEIANSSTGANATNTPPGKQ